MNAQELCTALASDLAAEIECHEAVDGRVACFLPLVYPDGDAVSVWVEQRGAEFEISDLGEGYNSLFSRYSPELKAFTPLAQSVCQSMGVVFADGRVTAGSVSADDLVEVIWTVGMASARVAEGSTYHRPRHKPSRQAVAALQEGFVHEVEAQLRQRHDDVTRHVPLVGASGHVHRVTIFIPSAEALIEPIEPQAGFKTVSSAYVKFGDIANVNGYSRYAVLDDRNDGPSGDIIRLLDQVANVVEWSEREPWLDHLESEL